MPAGVAVATSLRCHRIPVRTVRAIRSGSGPIDAEGEGVADPDGYARTVRRLEMTRCIVWVASNPNCANHAFNVSNGDCFRWRDVRPQIAKKFSMTAGRPRTITQHAYRIRADLLGSLGHRLPAGMENLAGSEPPECRPDARLLLCFSFYAFVSDIPLNDIADIPADKIFMVELSDFAASALPPIEISRHYRLFPGEGHSPMQSFLREVIKTGYAGCLSVEVFNALYRQSDPFDTAHRSMACTTCILQSL
ncbi:hypothetical protein [Bradyrhizobium sp. AZCC 2289]|uniref:hypothetical protein n=1 Tax=Bradyrhizobium sp. AZCC 2289 TaxID=3117026 RepID=UPI002FF32B61